MMKQKIKQKKRKKVSRNSGQGIIELALVLPIFILLFVGITDFARMVYTKHLMDKVTREAARAGAVEIDPADAIETAESLWGSEVTRHNSLSESTFEVEIVKVDGVDAVSVTATHPFSSIWTSGRFAIFSDLTLTSQTVMRKEG